jgi:hypothetical protein
MKEIAEYRTTGIVLNQVFVARPGTHGDYESKQSRMKILVKDYALKSV